MREELEDARKELMEKDVKLVETDRLGPGLVGFGGDSGKILVLSK